jgi:hypothetical protein
MNNYTLGRGKLYFDKFASSSSVVLTGERYFGNTPSFGISVASTALDHFDADNGIKVKDDSVTLELNRTGTFVTDNIEPNNVSLFLLGVAGTQVQAAASGQTYAIPGALQDRYYQVGASSSNPSGVRDITTVVVTAPDGAPAARANTTAYLVGAFYVPAIANAHYYKCTIAGTSAGAPPTFKTDGTTFADGTATFIDMGLIIKALTTDYTVDTDMGRIYIVTGGGISAGEPLSVSYSTLAKSRSQIITASTSTIDGALRFIATNPKGIQTDYYMPKVRLSPNGEFQLKGDAWQQLSFNLEILKLSDTVEAVYADGRPY